MTPESRIQYLDNLEQRETSRLQRAALVAWISIALAALVAAGLIYLAHRNLNNVQSQILDLDKKLESKKGEVTKLEDRYKTLFGAVESGEKARQPSAVKPLQPVQSAAQGGPPPPPPPPPVSTPQIYVQIVDEADRGIAAKMSDALNGAGYRVLGIETVSRAVGLKHNEVRFYKIADIDRAKEIANVLEKGLHKAVKVTYLGLENSAKVQPNHFEVWFAQQSKTE